MGGGGGGGWGGGGAEDRYLPPPHPPPRAAVSGLGGPRPPVNSPVSAPHQPLGRRPKPRSIWSLVGPQLGKVGPQLDKVGPQLGPTGSRLGMLLGTLRRVVTSVPISGHPLHHPRERLLNGGHRVPARLSHLR